MFTSCALYVLKSMIFILKTFLVEFQACDSLFMDGICGRLCYKYCVFYVLF